MTTSKWAWLSAALMFVGLVSGLIGSWPWWWSVFQAIWVAWMIRYAVKYRSRKPPSVRPSTRTPGDLMTISRASFPADYLEWFDWQAEIAGFPPPAKPAWEAARSGPSTRRMADELDPQWRRANAQEVRLVKPEVVIPCGEGPADLCNPYYGVGTGWRHVRNPDGSHEWRSKA